MLSRTFGFDPHSACNTARARLHLLKKMKKAIKTMTFFRCYGFEQSPLVVEKL